MIIMKMVNTTSLLIQFIKSAITGKQENIKEVNTDDIIQVTSLAKSQGILYLVIKGIQVNHIPIPKQIHRALLAEIYQMIQNETLFEKAKNVLNSAQIPFVPLKGSVIKNLYPDKWMRSSCDTDILVHENDLEKQ